MNKITLYYSHDPMCSFCWAFRPTWSKVKESLLLNSPQISIVNLLGGLAPDSDVPMPAEIKQKVSSAWKYIEKNIPGTQFNYDFWQTQNPRRSTYPACRAVMAAKMLDAVDDEMVLAIQQAYYLNAQNPSNQSTLIKCAESIGLPADEFTKTLNSEACQAEFTNERAQSQALGINSFPSLVLTQSNNRSNIPVDYNHPDIILSSIDEAARLLD